MNTDITDAREAEIRTALVETEERDRDSADNAIADLLAKIDWLKERVAIADVLMAQGVEKIDELRAENSRLAVIANDQCDKVLLAAENNRLAAESKQCREQNDRLVQDHLDLKRGINRIVWLSGQASQAEGEGRFAAARVFWNDLDTTAAAIL